MHAARCLETGRPAKPGRATDCRVRCVLLWLLCAGALGQQQLAGMNMAQMQLLPGGMAAAGVHPGVAGQGMMWPMNAASMQQANLAQYMQLQQQQGANPAVQQPASSQPPAAG